MALFHSQMRRHMINFIFATCMPLKWGNGDIQCRCKYYVTCNHDNQRDPIFMRARAHRVSSLLQTLSRCPCIHIQGLGATHASQMNYEIIWWNYVFMMKHFRLLLLFTYVVAFEYRGVTITYRVDSILPFSIRKTCPMNHELRQKFLNHKIKCLKEQISSKAISLSFKR